MSQNSNSDHNLYKPFHYCNAMHLQPICRKMGCKLYGNPIGIGAVGSSSIRDLIVYDDADPYPFRDRSHLLTKDLDEKGDHEGKEGRGDGNKDGLMVMGKVKILSGRVGKMGKVKEKERWDACVGLGLELDEEDDDVDEEDGGVYSYAGMPKVEREHEVTKHPKTKSRECPNFTLTRRPKEPQLQPISHEKSPVKQECRIEEGLEDFGLANRPNRKKKGGEDKRLFDWSKG